MRLDWIARILGMLLMLPFTDTQDYWPVHTVCNTNKIKVIYKSCDPMQDIGLSFSSCSNLLTQPTTLKIFVQLRQSINELYASVDLFLNGDFVLHHDEPFCLPSFPRFTFCGQRRGETIKIQSTLPAVGLSLQGEYNTKIYAINQNGFQILCFNATLTFK
ncbi:lymphocyte antigen 86 [Trichomycterus rosablanca]|uniref:lymphocyte antigen 86 n=1 Tax=Trichomycterus rosablanca TaxID=2290929 RepID=UPI002F361094